jgi:hypothetical protein
MISPTYGQEQGSETLCAGSHSARNISMKLSSGLSGTRAAKTLESSAGYCMSVQATASGPHAVRNSYLSGPRAKVKIFL